MKGLRLLMMVALAAGCRAKPPVNPAPQHPDVQVRPVTIQAVVDSQRVRWNVPPRDGQLSDSQLVALAPRIAGLRAEPDSLTIALGDSLLLPRLVRVLVVDDAGAVLGELRRYSFTLTGNLYIGPSGAIRARQAGSGQFSATIPARLTGDFRTRGPAVVRVTTVGTDGASVAAPRGSAVVVGVVRDSLGAPIAGALIRALHRGDGAPTEIETAVADGEGRFRMERLPSGNLTLFALHIGYQPRAIRVTLTEELTEQVELRLSLLRPTPLQTPPVQTPRPPE